jgi:hypothetical protein
MTESERLEQSGAQRAPYEGKKGRMFLMPSRSPPTMPPSLAERLSALDQPEHISDTTAIWSSVRPVLVMGRVVMVLSIIVLGELFDDARIGGLTVGVWALIAGIPLFLLASVGITYGDRLAKKEAGDRPQKP